MSLDRGCGSHPVARALRLCLELPVGVLALLGVLAVGAAAARADSIPYLISAGNTAVSAYPGPYAEVLVDLTSSTMATITFTSNSVGGYTYLFGDGASAAVNVNATSWTVGSFAASNAGTGFSPGTLSNGGSGNVDSFGVFNQTVNDFDGFMHAADSVQFTITNTSGTWATAGDVLTPNADGNVAAAHLFVCSADGYGNCNQADGALTTGFASQVPEPSTALLVGVASSILAARRPRRRNVRPA
jgi:hypothetical protein